MPKAAVTRVQLVAKVSCLSAAEVTSAFCKRLLVYELGLVRLSVHLVRSKRQLLLGGMMSQQ